jgi:hypothetical protein
MCGSSTFARLLPEIERACELGLPDDEMLAIAWRSAGIEEAIAARPTANSPAASAANVIRVAIIDFLIEAGVVSGDVRAGGEAFLSYLAEAPLDFSAFTVSDDSPFVPADSEQTNFHGPRLCRF